MNTQALYAAVWFFGYGFELACLLPWLVARAAKSAFVIGLLLLWPLFLLWPLLAGATVVDLIRGRGWPWDTQKTK